MHAVCRAGGTGLRAWAYCRKTQINVFELCGALCGLMSFQERLRGKRVVMFIDNKAALSMLIKGYPWKSDANDIVETAWHLMACLVCVTIRYACG